ncbi:MAG: hypothetical protein AMXMBFR84_02690 [Candidatus Hydrogenedentota bacterium]
MPNLNTVEDRAPAEWKPGDVILNLYEVKSVLGRGGMGTVYRVRHRGWDTELAVKSPHPDVIGHSRGAELFERECSTWVSLGLHPHVVSCFYVRRLGGIPRVFAEFVSGGTIHTWISRGYLYRGGARQALPRMFDLMIQVAWGLQHAHAHGIVHQDVKPANVLMSPEGMAKVTDFGLARALQAATGTERTSAPQGTPVYFSPEHATRDPITVATDVWSFGLLILEMFMGEVTWMAGQTAPQVLDGYLELGPERDYIPPMPEKLMLILRQCFEINPANRPQGMPVLVESLKDLYEEHTGKPYPRIVPEAKVNTADEVNNRAVSLLDLGNREEAAKLWKQALDLTPHHLEASYNQALHCWRTGKITDLTLLKHIKGLHERYPKSWMPHYMLAHVHLERGDCESATNVLKHLEVRELQGHEIQEAIQTAEANIDTSRKLQKKFGESGKVVKALKLSWDGALALSAGGPSEGPGEINVWNVNDGTLIQSFTGHKGQVRCIELSADGMQAASGGKDGVVRLWPMSAIGDEHVLKDHSKPVLAVLFTEDGRAVVSGSVDGTIRVWDRQSGRTLKTIVAHANGVTAMAIGEYNRTIVSAGKDGALRLWELETGNCVREYRTKSGYPHCVAVSGDRRYLASGTDKGYIDIWELSTGKHMASRRLHSTPLTSICLSKKGRYAVTGTTDATMRLWEIRSGRCLHTFAGSSPISLSGDENTALSPGADGSLCLWRIGFEIPELSAPMLICRSSQNDEDPK